MFRKYPSIENHYREKFIQKFLYIYPELKNAEFIITEKLHGSNTSLVFSPGDNVVVCSRNRELSREEDTHFNIWDAIDNDLYDLVTVFKEYAMNISKDVTLHGEFFGPGIQKGIFYGDKKQYRVFDLRIDDHLVPQCEMLDIFKFLRMSQYIVPIIAIVKGIQIALSWDTRFDSLLINTTNNECEGIVIKPYRKLYIHPCGAILYIKKKNEKFSEKAPRVHKPHKPHKPVDTKVGKLREEFLLYINENRVQSVFSKEGIIDSPKEMSKYIGLIMINAQEAFKKDFETEISDMDKKTTKQIFKPGVATIVKLLKQHL